MRKLILSVVDLLIVGIAFAVAVLVHDEFVVQSAKLAALLPYVGVSLVLAALLIALLDVNTHIWRTTNLSDYAYIFALAAIVAAGTYLVFGAMNGAAGIPRSLPVLHGVFMMFALVGVRVAARVRHRMGNRDARASGALAASDAAEQTHDTVVVVGAGRLAELYVRAMSELEHGQVRIAGILGSTRQNIGLRIFGHEVLGSYDDVEAIIDHLLVHGVDVRRLMITLPMESLSEKARAAIARLEQSGRVRVDRLNEYLREPRSGADAAANSEAAADAAVSGRSQTALVTQRLMGGHKAFWRFKRCLDVSAALALLLVLWPVCIVVAIAVAFDAGLPVMFWQERPGRDGRLFRLYKFRSMGNAVDADGRRRSDAERQTRLGSFLRRTRLDELPQLFNILIGDMSFVGPRPLLRSEQSGEFAARLLVRPGLTGWAQVIGGRDIPFADKAALDIWYVHNASLWRDAEVLLRTVPMILFGERVSRSAIVNAWRDLEQVGIGHIGQTVDASAGPARPAAAG